ncbi:MAG: DUF362 domain-containing protein [Armatimonadetes bacterium]|nr:DUF362 domain-containing protein [Armatimonadota bacterium]
MSRVCVAPCSGYDPASVRRAVRECFECWPDASSRLSDGARVLLKPNMINARPPESAVCTHPALVRAVAEICCEAGCEVVVADEPGYALVDDPGRLFSDAGIVQALEGLPVEVRLLKHGGYREVSVDRPLRVSQLRISRMILDADVVINLPKCKTHQMTLFTGAVKNMFGALAPRDRVRLHMLGEFVAFGEAVADTFSTCIPDFNLMDAVTAMEGKGPSHGKPRQLGVVLASADAVALDTVAAHLIGITADEIQVIVAAADRGHGSADLAGISVGDVDLTPFRQEFERPPGGIRRGFPGWMGRLVQNSLWVRPKVLAGKCIRCGACAAICPGDAIIIRRHAEIDRDKCIECFCCQEVCPVGAIDTATSFLYRTFLHGRRGRPVRTA